MNYTKIYQKYKEESISGRYIALKHIEQLLKNNNAEVIGKSVLKQPIYKLNFGTGKTKILLWSQMHGNESTTTKALSDLIKFLNSNSEESNTLLKNFTFCILPMVNPDGAAAYTRVNANEVDLNRDAKELTQPESKALRSVFDDFQPDYCYNLHDQRTIFGVGETSKPATLSFLAPSFDKERSWNDCRLKAAQIIVAMNSELQKHIPGQIGRFDDSFNLNCIGDMFQSLNVPTILFEAGHFADDYEREITRKYIFIALLSSFEYMVENDIVRNKREQYLSIPQNKVSFFDVVCRNIKINYDSTEKCMNFALQYREILQGDLVTFELYLAQIDQLENYFGHTEIFVEEENYFISSDELPLIGEKANFKIGNHINFVNGIKNC